MLVHKGGQINNVQLISEVRIAEMSQLQNCSAMCTRINNGSYYENEKIKRENVRGEGGGGGGVRGDMYKEWKLLWKGEKSRGGGGGECEQKSEAFVKIQKKNIFFFGGGGTGLGGGVTGSGGRDEVEVRVDVNEEVMKLSWKFKKNFFWGVGGRVGGVRLGLGGQGGCERRSEAFVKIQEKILYIYIFFFLGGGGGSGRVGGGFGGGGSGWMWTGRWSFCENSKIYFFLGGGRGGGWVWGGGVRVDVNGEVKFLWKFKKKIFFFGRGGGGGGRAGVWSGVGVGRGGGSKVWGWWVMWGKADANQE